MPGIIRRKRRAAWVVPDPIEGSGGVRTIFSHIQSLIEHGIECHVYFPQSQGKIPARKLLKLIERYYGSNDVIVHPSGVIDEKFDLIFATAWYTAPDVRWAPQDCPKIYFLQDFEASFHSMGYEYLLTENSYRYGFFNITMGRWLAREIAKRYHTAAQFIDLCADGRSYYRIRNAEHEKAICFIHQPEKPRRCSRLGLEALGIVKNRVPDVKIYLYGSVEEAVISAECRNLGLISVAECNQLYNRCKVGLCLSSSNPSRVPFEMMAAGLPVVELHRENNLYDLPEDAVLLAEQNPESLAGAVIRLLDDDARCAQMSASGIRFMKDRSLETGYDQFCTIVDRILSGRVDKQKVTKSYSKPPYRADQRLMELARQIFSREIELPASRIPVSGANGNAGLAQAVKKFVRRYKGQKICFYGAGTYAKTLVEDYDWSKVKLQGFIDRDPIKIGQNVGEYPIYPLSELKKLNPEYLVITIAGGERHYDSIKRDVAFVNRKVQVLRDFLDDGKRGSSSAKSHPDERDAIIRGMEQTIRNLRMQVTRLSVNNIFNDPRTKSNIKKLLQKTKTSKLCIYGAGFIAEELLKRYDLSKIKLVDFIDRDPQKAGKNLGKYKIHPPEDLAKLNPDLVLLALSRNNDEVELYLQKIRKSNNLKFKAIKNFFKRHHVKRQISFLVPLQQRE